MKRTAWLVWVLALLLAAPLQGVIAAYQTPRGAVPAILRYLSPGDGNQFVQPGASIALRLDGPIDPLTVSPARFSLVGSVSGRHTGRTRIADDNTTVVFLPAAPFAAGEGVTLNIAPGLATRAGSVFAGLRAGFTISAGGADVQAVARAMAAADTPPAGASDSLAPAPGRPNALATRPQDYVTFPDDFPAYTVTVPVSATAPGLLFMAPLNIASPVNGNFLFITDDSGEPVFWQRTAQQFFDFKEQPDGSLTYFDTFQNQFIVLNSAYSQTKTITPANGYQPNFHELQILPNGHALFIVNDPEITDTTSYGGSITATVVGQIIQELDTDGLPVFQWDTWSHFALSDTYSSLTTPMVDYVHMNALELDQGDNLLVSSRHLSEITKIDRSTKNILWRMGGKNNQFTGFGTDPDGMFSCQHDIRRLANGNVTVFDNHNPGACSGIGGGAQSRAVEYQIDETNKVVTNTWQYQNPLGNFAPFTGNNQRLPDGHRFVDWGYSFPSMSEVLTDGTKIFELTFGPPYFSYRASRSPWSAVPVWAPTLVLTGTQAPTLYYSWNGATDVASYNIYGGFGSAPNVLLGSQPRTGFEDHTLLASLPAGYCAFRVQPLNHSALPQSFSNVVYSLAYCPAALFPVIFR